MPTPHPPSTTPLHSVDDLRHAKEVSDLRHSGEVSHDDV